ncbi:BrnA antitoxin family protein [Roseobacter sp. YSTF-M11]|uniref:BrnA antitoxin family protein n=1 Tax=Roseobacter insulae TaxID=2859783 RepID=A0A9X1FYT1_9RHOB|nr:BrnA antitoxin family protein [Roseobacter insulae]MBW4709418.1 BrnA antitoxin family protein [Roseobacter insulae]
MSTKGQRAAETEMMHELERLQQDLSAAWLDQSLPRDWTGLEWDAPVGRPKTRITLRLDSDMVRWFRKLGPGYQARINRVLRIYWMALLSGHIKGYPEDNTVPRLLAEARRVQEEIAADRGRM